LKGYRNNNGILPLENIGLCQFRILYEVFSDAAGAVFPLIGIRPSANPHRHGPACGTAWKRRPGRARP
jgi:hypothetical protein